MTSDLLLDSSALGEDEDPDATKNIKWAWLGPR